MKLQLALRHSPRAGSIRAIAPILSIACFSMAATSCASAQTEKPLTVQRVAELTAPTKVRHAKSYTLTFDGLELPASKASGVSHPPSRPGPMRATFSARKTDGVIEVVREFIFPTKFDPPRARGGSSIAMTPTTPRAFETRKTGWTIRVSVKQEGKLLAVAGVADYVEAELVPGGYGAVAGPVQDGRGTTISDNTLLQPRFQTTTTRFHIFALPGESYGVTLYRGTKPVKSIVTLTAQ